MVDSPVVFGLIAMFAWGIWAALANVAAETIDPTMAMVFSYSTSVIVAMGYVWTIRDELALSGVGVGWALFAGVFAGIGAVAFYGGLAEGRTGVVTTISALYFVIATILGITMLGESFGLREVLGVAFAIAAVVMFTG